MIKQIMKRIIYGNKSDSETYIKYLKKMGVKIGDRVTIFVPMKTIIDETRPWLLEIGNDVQITEGVTILTHGYDWSVLQGKYGEVIGSSGAVKIGNNVFIGMNSTILKGVHIGNNVIVGAASLVNKDIPDDSVVAGNPARIIMTIDEYYKKRKQAQFEEASELVRLYRERYNKEPDEKALHEYFWLFCNTEEDMPECWRKLLYLSSNLEKSLITFKNHKKEYVSLNDFLNNIK